MSQVKTNSHLSVESQQAKPTGKERCEWCRVLFAVELSDAQDKNRYCSRTCERYDEDIMDAYRMQDRYAEDPYGTD